MPERPTRGLTVVKRMGLTPEIGSCAACGKVFIVPISTLKSAEEAESNLRLQFDSHVCPMQAKG